MSHNHFSLELFRDLYRYMEWADGSVWKVVHSSEAARDDAKLKELLHHLHMVQRLFLAMWTDQSPVQIAQSKATDFAQLRDLEAWARPYYAEVRRFLDTADAAILTRPVVMPWIKQYEAQLGTVFAEPSGAETMFQVVNHTTHHRAQINTQLRSLGSMPPIVDYIAWVWFGRPAAAWEISAT